MTDNTSGIRRTENLMDEGKWLREYEASSTQHLQARGLDILRDIFGWPYVSGRDNTYSAPERIFCGENVWLPTNSNIAEITKYILLRFVW